MCLYPEYSSRSNFYAHVYIIYIADIEIYATTFENSYIIMLHGGSVQLGSCSKASGLYTGVCRFKSPSEHGVC
jgi:hypothetical protein